jgi:alkyl sulfatase BDS1-like metallo-beta-lactamase superfamily hydrolase
VESDHGVIVIDPLVSQECAAAALALYRRHRGDKAVTGVIYTHSHVDHFGGVLGVVDAGTSVPIIAPEHFMEHSVSENVYAGAAMLRRGVYYSGSSLPVGPEGRVGMGLGAAASTGTIGLIAPTLDITHTGQEEVIDGIRIVFQMTPGTEAPAEMNFHFPAQRALCLAENATHNLHNLLTLRGAQVRDPRIWSRYIAEAAELFLDGTDVAFASHHWPTWGRDNIARFLTDSGEHYWMELSNGVLIHHPTRRAPEADLTLTLTHPQLLGLLASGSLAGIDATGDPGVLKTLMSLVDDPEPSFAVVTP